MFCITTSGLCSFEYRAQPPSTTLQGCNPYDQGNRIRISLECIVRRQSGVSDQFIIKWFRKNTTGVAEDLGLGDPVQQGSRDQTSRYHDTALFNQPYSPSLLGKYWCQVINTTADPDQPLMRSNMFTLLAPGNYSGPTCPGTMTAQRENKKNCADQPAAQLTPSSISTTTVTISTALEILSLTTLVVSDTGEQLYFEALHWLPA